MQLSQYVKSNTVILSLLWLFLNGCVKLNLIDKTTKSTGETSTLYETEVSDTQEFASFEFASGVDGRTWKLPQPNTSLTPSAPPAWSKSPGGVHLPKFTKVGDVGAPAIGFQTDTTFSNETIAVMGDKLQNANFILWAEGMTYEVDAIRKSTDKAQIVVPNMVPKSVLFLWPHNSSGFGTPVRLNAPVLFWVWPGKKWTRENDRSIRIFGKNFDMGRPPLVIVKRGIDAPVSLEVTYKSANEIRADLPDGYQAGTYQVWVHNGTGGKFGWSEAGSFSVSENTYKTLSVFLVDAQLGSTDQEKIYNAVAAAHANGGGTVSFLARTYNLTANINVPLNGGSSIILKGAGAGHTLITSPGTSQNPERYINLTGAGSGVRDMKLVGVRIDVQNEDVNIDNIDATANNHPLSNYEIYMIGGVHPRQKINLNVTNSTFRAVNAGAYIGWASFIRFNNCHFYGRYHDGVYNESGVKFADNNLDNHGISFRSTHNVIVENSDFQSEDPLNGKILTRAIAVLHSADSHHVYSSNKMNWIGAFPSSPSRDTNTGEVILFHGDDVGLMSAVESADWETVTVQRPVSDFTQNDFNTYTGNRGIELGLLKAYVVSGPATGQILSLKNAIDGGTGKTKLQVSRFQNVMPNAGDKVLVRPIFYQNLVLNNQIDSVPDAENMNLDFNRTGILFWLTSHDSVVSGNNIKHTTEAIRIQSVFNGKWVQGSNHIRGNTITESLHGGPYNLYSKCYADVGGTSMFSSPGTQIYSIGNVFRDNICSGAKMGVEVGSSDHDNILYPRSDAAYSLSPKTGVVHSIIENNDFTGITGTSQRPNLGFAISTSANWTLLRNNTMDWEGNIDFYMPQLIYEALEVDTKVR